MKTLFAFAALLLYILVNVYVISEVRSILVQIYPTMRPIGATSRPIRPHQKAARRSDAKRSVAMRSESEAMRSDEYRCAVKCADK